jgi:hypothetical protein
LFFRLEMNTNPHSAEVHYTIDLMAFYAARSKPGSLRIATLSNEIALAVARRFSDGQCSLIVETLAVQESLSQTLGINASVRYPLEDPADVAIFPFSFPESLSPAGEKQVVVACENAFSYKNLLHPGAVRKSIFRTLKELSPAYSFVDFAGLYSPILVFWLTLAKLVEKRRSSGYFRLEDIAMRRMFHFGPLWRLSYLVVFTGRAV